MHWPDPKLALPSQLFFGRVPGYSGGAVASRPIGLVTLGFRSQDEAGDVADAVRKSGVIAI
ncbi:hypothetical protein MHPYR_90125 [uncultured Mycobacterium sp.]|uniref:Uncharacterized protein n=1 Tax=uncultured Mycobacterium sp. TaxID=171292 RepID=A0A1Y5PM87_9MYCO|nr:hypothetical protein MHPYR_90125 [uncultured Mycobacterium sp.]